jgi:hypothetical protein
MRVSGVYSVSNFVEYFQEYSLCSILRLALFPLLYYIDDDGVVVVVHDIYNDIHIHLCDVHSFPCVRCSLYIPRCVEEELQFILPYVGSLISGIKSQLACSLT